VAEIVYECMFIFNANAYARNPTGAANNIEEMVKTLGGEVLANRLFDERKLAYPINGHRKGVYWLTYAKMETTSVVKFNRACRLNDMILRHMVVKIDPRLVDAMVSMAQGKVAAPPSEPESTSKEETEVPAETPVEKTAEEATIKG